MNDEYLLKISLEKNPEQEIIPEPQEVSGSTNGSRWFAAIMLIAAAWWILGGWRYFIQ